MDVSKCTQCGTTAIVEYGGNALCVDHHLKMQQAHYLQASLLAANINYLDEEIARGTGYLLPPNRLEIPKPPFMGDQLTLNNINVSGSTVGAINTGTIQQLDSEISLLTGHGNHELASALKDLTQAIIDNQELPATEKDEAAQQLAFLGAQLTIKPDQRSRGVVKGLLSGMTKILSVSTSLMTLWDKLRPLLEQRLLA